MILKWGGELTELGRQQARELGKRFRCMYPGSRNDNSGAQDGLGFLRLHSTYRHDLKIYASDEGRVQTTAAAFAKGLLGSYFSQIFQNQSIKVIIVVVAFVKLISLVEKIRENM